jgi:hypothetical protein
MSLVETGAVPTMPLKTAALLNSSTGRKGMRGCSWFSLFLWPTFRRIFLLDRKREIWRQRADPCPPPAALSSKKPNDNVPASTVARIITETQIEHWIRWTLESNITLAAALKRLQGSYKLLQAGKPARDVEEILEQVDAALKTVEKRSI